MAKSSKTLVAIAIAGATALGVMTLSSRFDSGGAEVEDTRNLVNQVWINKLPRDSRDLIDHFVLVQGSHGRIGAVGRSSQWRHFFEIFQWGLEGQRLSVYFPQEDRKGAVKVKTWKCRGEAPEPFELCLEISAGKRSMNYYSMEEWVIEPEQAEASLEDLAEEHPAIAAVFTDAIEATNDVEIEDVAIEATEELDAWP